MSDNDCVGARVLVLEDSGLMAMDIEAALSDAGYHAVVTSSVAAAMAAIDGAAFACALLDFQLADGDCTAIALALAQRRCAVALVSGYEPGDLVAELKTFTLFRKPVQADELVGWVTEQLGGSDFHPLAPGTFRG